MSGLSVWCDEVEADYVDGSGQTGIGRRRFELFFTEEGDTVAHLVVTPPDALPARPIHRVAILSDLGDLDRFLQANDPSECLAVAPWVHASDRNEDLWAGLRVVPPFPPGSTLRDRNPMN
ncbi:hypothetical protein [Rhodovulum sp. P5]|uniref:hypothetical protein n=1 Tax=Rhodovulum sp. P5 TaxID=1564506 RepID=UPI0012EB6135|nr:hypothetical protein [Rhodovulum sp. P5]